MAFQVATGGVLMDPSMCALVILGSVSFHARVIELDHLSDSPRALSASCTPELMHTFEGDPWVPAQTEADT